MAVAKLTNKTEIQNYLLREISEDFDVQLDSWIDQVTAYISIVTGKNFVLGADEAGMFYDGNGSTVLFVDDFVISDDFSVEIDGVAVPFEQLKFYPANSPVKYQIQYDGVFPRGNQNVQVIAKLGSAESVPTDITFAATVLVAGILQANAPGDGTVVKEKIGNFEVTYRNEKERSDHMLAMDILTRHKNYYI